MGDRFLSVGGPVTSPCSVTAMEIKGPEKPPRSNIFAFGCALLASTTSILLGYDTGVMSGAAIFIKKDMKIDDTKVEVLVGIISLYSLIGSAAAGRTSDWIGRKLTMVAAAAIFLIGAIMMGLATNYPFLMTGRFVAGIGVGYGLMIAPVYTTEIAPASSRGFLTSFPEVFINIGALLGYVSNYAFAKLPQHLSWRLMLGVSGIPSVVLGVGVLSLPESPRWLVMQGRFEEARRVLYRTSDSGEEAESRLADIKHAAGICEDSAADADPAANSNRERGRGVWRELLLRPSPSVRRIVIAAVGIHLFQQASGIDSVVLYGPRVFQSAGLGTNSRLLAATVAVGFTKTIFIMVSTFLLDRVGRRPLLLTSTAGMIVSLLGLASGLAIVDHHGDTRVTWAIVVCVACVLSFVAFFSIGLGPIAWVYSSEILPLRLRGQGASLGVVANRVTSGLISMTFISLYKAITIAGSFFMFAAIAAAAWIFFYTFLPETRGRSLEEIGELFHVPDSKSPGTGKRRGSRHPLQSSPAAPALEHP